MMESFLLSSECEFYSRQIDSLEEKARQKEITDKKNYFFFSRSQPSFEEFRKKCEIFLLGKYNYFLINSSTLQLSISWLNERTAYNTNASPILGLQGEPPPLHSWP